jgi:hypothetical protein
LSVLTLAGALLAAALIAPATAAWAGDSGSCSGTLVIHKNLNYSGTKIGELDVYFNSSTGVNCAKMNHGGPTWGVARETWAYIGKCEETNPTGTCHLVTDDKDLDPDARYYAGPVSVNAGNHCITASGYIYWQGAPRRVNTASTAAC